MPPIVQSAVKGKKSTAYVRLDPITRGKLRLYSRYAGVKTEEVIRGALDHLFAADVEFGPYYEQHKDGLTTPARNKGVQGSPSRPRSVEMATEESAPAMAAVGAAG